MTDEEETLIRSLSEAFNHVVLILNVGYPMDLSFMDTCKVDAVLYTGFGGMYGGKAIMDVLLGRYNPSGRLPDTWAFHYDSIPSSKNFYDCRDGKKRLVTDEDICWVDTVYEEDIYVGYRYFETFKNADRRGYPFGYGLSYTSFDRKLKDLSFDSTGVSFSILVTNTGDREGSDVVQIYVSKPETLLEQPAKELVEYEKTASLKPGEGQQLDFFIPVKRLSSFLTDNAQYVISKGTYTFFEGNNVSDCRKIADYTVEENQEVKNVKNLMSPMKQIKLLTKKAINLPDGSQSGIMEGRNGIEPQKSYSYREIPEIEKIEEKEKITFADLQEDHTLLDRFIGGLSLEELARISVCGSHGWTVDGLGEAGRLATIDGLLLPNMVVADGNSGVNLKTKNVGMPSGVTLCASFNKKLMERVGSVIGKEAKELGINLILAPALNIHRNPLNGRHPEYFSEDPFLAGTMAGNYCKGLESTGVGGCYKHLLANNAESSRKRNQSILSERALREIYFKAFEYALEIHEPVSVMTAYNAVNGKFASCDEELIQGLLYEENGFEGFVMTDWTSYDSANVQEMVAAGNAWITPGSTDNTYTDMIVEGVNEKKISLGRLQDNVRRIIKALLWLNKETN